MGKLTAEELAQWDESKQTAIIVSVIAFLIIGNVAVVLRLLAQFRQWGKLFWEDHFIIIALVCADVMNAGTLICVYNGLGLHFWRVVSEDPYGIVTIFQLQWIDALFTGPGYSAIRLSLLFFFRRVFTVGQKWPKIFWWANMVYNILWFLGSTTYFIFQCWPIDFYWQQWYTILELPISPKPYGHCAGSGTSLIVLPLALGLLADIALIFMPIISLWQLQMSWGRKFGLLILFMLGSVACVLELVRIVILEVETDIHSDPTWGIVTFDILTSCEPMTAILCACVPHIWAQIRKKKIQRSQNRSGSNLGYGSNLAYGSKGTSVRMSAWKPHGDGHRSPMPAWPQAPATHGANTSATALRRQSGSELSDLANSDHAINIKTDIEWSSSKVSDV